MFRASSLLSAAVVAVTMTASAHAASVLPGDASVRYSANVDGFFVSSSNLSLFGVNSYADVGPTNAPATPAWVVEAGATTGNYADGGIVLGFDGSLSLGQFQSVAVNLLPGAGQTTPTINLWLDIDNNNQFFSFDGAGKLTGLAGDSYFGAAAAGDINGSTLFDFLGGAGGNGQFTLSQLQAGARAGVDSNTKVALWIGVTNGDYFSPNYADIASVNLTSAPATAAVPLPASVWSGLALFAGTGIVRGLKKMRSRIA